MTTKKLPAGYKVSAHGRIVPRGYKIDPVTDSPAKPVWTSRTQWMAVITVVAGFFPSVQSFVANHPEVVIQALGIIFMVLRFVTKGAVTLTD
jgi:hypothetical protein